MSVTPVAWATMRPARPSHRVPATATSDGRADVESAGRCAVEPTSATTSSATNDRAQPDDQHLRRQLLGYRPPSRASLAAADRLASAPRIAGNAATTPASAPPISMPIPIGRSIVAVDARRPSSSPRRAGVGAHPTCTTIGADHPPREHRRRARTAGRRGRSSSPAPTFAMLSESAVPMQRQRAAPRLETPNASGSLADRERLRG